MHIERFFVSGLAHVSYVVASGIEAVVVDPQRNIDGYLAYLLKIGSNCGTFFLRILTRISWLAMLSCRRQRCIGRQAMIPSACWQLGGFSHQGDRRDR